METSLEWFSTSYKKNKTCTHALKIITTEAFKMLTKASEGVSSSKQPCDLQHLRSRSGRRNLEVVRLKAAAAKTPLTADPISIKGLRDGHSAFVLHHYPENAQIIHSSLTPTQIICQSWHVSILAHRRGETGSRLNNRCNDQTALFRSVWMVTSHTSGIGTYSLRSPHMWRQQGCGVTMAWSWEPTDRHARPTYTPLFPVASDFVYGLKDWVGWDQQYSPESAWLRDHGGRGEGGAECWVGAGRHSDFPWRSRDLFYSFLWC